jgi:stearoyl-CoA desaturase (delta-9 desaturase)
MQLRHFVVFNVLPTIGTIAAFAWAHFYPIGRLELGLFLSLWLLTGLGASAGYHRLFTHRSYKAATPVRVILAILGSMSGLGPVISWVAYHRRHHELSDEPGDMHSPNMHGNRLLDRVRGFMHAQFAWEIQHEYPNLLHYAGDLLRDPVIVRTSSLYEWWVLLGLALPAAVGGGVTGSWLGAMSGFLWGGVVRMFAVRQSWLTQNSLFHVVGSRPFPLRDNSRNIGVLALFVWGEAWHQNHHAFPSSASVGLAWYRIDPSYWLIRMLEKLGVAWDLRVPTKAQIASRMCVDTSLVSPEGHASPSEAIPFRSGTISDVAEKITGEGIHRDVRRTEATGPAPCARATARPGHSAASNAVPDVSGTDESY